MPQNNEMHYLGPAGTFSEEAAKRFSKILGSELNLLPHATISDMVKATAKEGGLGVVPYYNLIDGLVQESMDRILATGLKIRHALQLPIQIGLGGPAGYSADCPVYSHPKALAQCSEYLDAHHPRSPRRAVSSTAEGAERAKAENALSLASMASLEAHDFEILCDDATNRYFGRRNYTEFLLVSGEKARPESLPPEANRCVLACAPQTDRPGLLADILSLLAMFDVNLARLHSRPAIAAASTELDPQVFYLEIAGTLSEQVLQICAESLALTLGGPDQNQVLFEMGQYSLSPLASSGETPG